jgi:hypothetical protein
MPNWKTNVKAWIEEHAPVFVLRPIMKWRYRRRAGRPDDTERVFTDIFRHNEWGDAQSRSGPGSNLDSHYTAVITRELPKLLRELDCKSFLDVPCGDFAWMQHLDLSPCRYFGGDIVAPLIAQNQLRHGRHDRTFLHLDLTRDDFPPAIDLIMVRDCFIHLSFQQINAALRNIRRNNVKFLLASTYRHKKRNWDIQTGGFRPINLQREPFNLPPPLRFIQEDSFPENKRFERSLGLWPLESLPA